MSTGCFICIWINSSSLCNNLVSVKSTICSLSSLHPDNNYWVFQNKWSRKYVPTGGRLIHEVGLYAGIYGMHESGFLTEMHFLKFWDSKPPTLLKPHCIRCSHFKVDDVRALEANSKPPVRIVEDGVTALVMYAMTLVTAWMSWRRNVDLLVLAGTSTRLDWIKCGFKYVFYGCP
jgi:hypothetical protein